MRKMLTCILSFGVLILCLVPSFAHAQEGGVLRAIENEIVSILESNRHGVVRIHALFAPDPNQTPSGPVFTHGSGFVFDSRGYILTIDAAVQGAEEIRVTLTPEKQVRARLVGSDPISGVAVIQVDVDPLPKVEIGDSERMRFGHYAFILGNDFGNLVPVSGTVHEIFQEEDLIQVSARVQSSYGGAPVFCSDGRVGGMVWRYQDNDMGYTPLGTVASPFMGVPGTPHSVLIGRCAWREPWWPTEKWPMAGWVLKWACWAQMWWSWKWPLTALRKKGACCPGMFCWRLTIEVWPAHIICADW